MSQGRHKRDDHPCTDCHTMMIAVDVYLQRCPLCRKIYLREYHHKWQLKRDGGVRKYKHRIAGRLTEIAVVNLTDPQRNEAVANIMRRRQRVPIYQHAKLQDLDPTRLILAVGAILNGEAVYVTRKIISSN